MFHFPIGRVCRMTLPDIDNAFSLGLDGVQLWVDPAFQGQKLREFMSEVSARSLQVSALCGDIGGYTDAEVNKTRVPQFKKSLETASQIGVKVVTTHIGAVPDDSSSEAYAVLQEACASIGRYAESLGTVLAIETGTDTAVHLKAFIESLGTRGVAVNLDPANLVMCIRDDPAKAVVTLKDYIVHTHAKDGIAIPRKTPGGEWDREETPLGEGGVDFSAYLKALDSIGYRGFLAIERETNDPEADIAKGATYLRKVISEAE